MVSFITSFGLAEWLIGIGAVLSVVGTLLLGVKQGRDQIEVRDQIIKEQRNLVTGGESYFFVRPSLVSGSNEILLLTEFKGNHPIYDMTIDVQEFDRERHGSKYSYQLKNSYVVQIGTVHPLKASSIFKQIVLPVNNSEFGKRFFLKISSRNGFVEEDIYLRTTADGYSQAFKVVQFIPKYGETSSGLPLDTIEARVKKIDQSFPITELDHLNGDSGWNRSYQFE